MRLVLGITKIIIISLCSVILASCSSEQRPKEPVRPETHEQKINYWKIANLEGQLVGIEGYKYRDKRKQSKTYSFKVIFYDKLEVIPRGMAIPDEYIADIPLTTALINVNVSKDIQTQKAIQKLAIEVLKRTVCRGGRVGIINRLATSKLSQSDIAEIIRINDGKIAGGYIPPDIKKRMDADLRAARKKPRIIVGYDSWPLPGASVSLNCTY